MSGCWASRRASSSSSRRAIYTKGRLLCEGDSAEPCKSFKMPFHLGIDQQDRIWVTNGGGDYVVRFPASDPSKVEKFKSGYSGSGLGIDSQGNVWVTNRFGSGVHGLERMVKLGIVMLLGGTVDRTLAYSMFEQKGGPDGGSVTLFRPDGTEFPGSPFYGGGLPGPWAATVAGDDTVWISNFAGAVGRIAHLCGVKTENCPPGFKTGDQISPPGRLRRRRPADADRSRNRSGGRRLGDRQLAGHQ